MTVEVNETAAVVRLSLTWRSTFTPSSLPLHPPNPITTLAPSCAASTEPVRTAVSLQHPLGERLLIDSSTLRQIPTVNASSMLVPPMSSWRSIDERIQQTGIPVVSRRGVDVQLPAPRC